MKHCVAVSTETFPSIIPDAIYMGYRQQIDGRTFGMCHLNSMRIEPAHEFGRDERMRLVPRARPCNIDQYLVCYVPMSTAEASLVVTASFTPSMEWNCFTM